MFTKIIRDHFRDASPFSDSLQRMSSESSLANQAIVDTRPQGNFGQEYPEVLGQNRIGYHQG